MKLSALTDNYLRNTSLSNNQLNLVFKYNVKEKSIKYFTIKKKNIVKHIFDIKNVALPKTKNISQFKAKGVKAFRIAQYNKKLVRVVIETTVALNSKIRFKTEGRKVLFFLAKHKKKSIIKKKAVVKKNYRTNKYHYNHKRKYKTIILDAGHGGRDIGASSRYVREKDLTLSMTLKLKSILQKMGYRVLLTRNRDTFMNLKQRTDYAYYRNGSIFLSIHANAEPKKKTKGVLYEGMEVFYLGLQSSNRSKNKRAVYRGKKVYTQKAYETMVSSWKFSQSRKLAKNVHQNILSHVHKQYTLNDKGIKRQDFWVLLATKIPSILIETGYLTNKSEVRKLINPHYQIRIMEGVARGINQYYGLY